MSEYLKKFEKFEKKVEELKKLEYCDLYSVTEENLGKVSNEIARKLIYIVKGDKGSRYVDLDWRDHDEPGYPEFKKIKETDVIGVGYIDGLWATVLTKGDLDYVDKFVGNDFDKVSIFDMYEE